MDAYRFLSHPAASLLLVAAFVVAPVVCRAASAPPPPPSEWTNLRLTDDEVAADYRMASQRSAAARLLNKARAKWQELLKQVPAGTPHPAAEELAAIDFYRGEEGYHDINGWLRGLQPETFSPDELRAFSRLIVSGMNKMPADRIRTGQVFRGAWVSPERLARDYAVGAVVVEQAFTSTSVAGHVADEFAFGAEAPQRSVVFTIESKSGRLITMYLEEENFFEAEVLFRPGTAFRVTSQEVDEYDTVQVHMVEVDAFGHSMGSGAVSDVGRRKN